MINYICLFLLITPIYGVFTDLKIGKIKNYFVFPLILISLILMFFIEGFFTIENIIGIFILFFFGFLFYRNNKWGAGDGKYMILIGFNSMIISFLKGFGINIINILFFNIFLIIFFISLFFIFYNGKKIKKINFKKSFKFNFLRDFGNIFFLLIFSNLIGNYFGTSYIYLSIFLFILLIIPIFNNIKSKYFFIIFVILGVFFTIYNNIYTGFFYITIIFYIFSFLQNIFEQIFEIIDIKTIKVFNLKSGDILSNKSIKKINKNLKTNFEQSPLQGNEVFEIIGFYKNNKKNIKIEVYKSIKLGIVIYSGYFMTIVYFL